jgi:hypothetical protein
MGHANNALSYHSYSRLSVAPQRGHAHDWCEPGNRAAVRAVMHDEVGPTQDRGGLHRSRR